jgi:hypothetical protein
MREIKQIDKKVMSKHRLKYRIQLMIKKWKIGPKNTGLKI